MAFDFKKEYREFYLPKDRPEIVAVPAVHYMAVRGQGDPNQPEGAYRQAIQMLYTVAYTLKMSGRAGHEIDGFFDYVVPPLEGLWWQEGQSRVDYAHKETFSWIAMIRLPEFVTKQEFDWAVAEAAAKKKLDLSKVEYFTYDEGLCVQCMHLGPFDTEAETVARMDSFLAEKGYVNDLSETRMHHEIYLSDARRVIPEKWKTVIRPPIRRGGDTSAAIYKGDPEHDRKIRRSGDP